MFSALSRTFSALYADNASIIFRTLIPAQTRRLTIIATSDKSLSSLEQQVLDEQVIEWRSRLLSQVGSCFVQTNPLPDKPNQEEGFTGRFWERRFKSQALLDEKALTACMAYVDLNPVRVRGQVGAYSRSIRVHCHS
ncbi:MAG: hypothetical protein KZQ89_01730 [Candidatus Thiodiazotropha sp. (ex Lucinoma kastoroae)]|nr:hypothetical protein [Candidatus Thiodiazotropha sp. (ex Rostrolucina anterorostrata)]MCU7846723.1 hypothetical protein [Candidatus Thiodiazotropha sp. (ex Lucinoma kastoroae)]